MLVRSVLRELTDTEFCVGPEPVILARAINLGLTSGAGTVCMCPVLFTRLFNSNRDWAGAIHMCPIIFTDQFTSNRIGSDIRWILIQLTKPSWRTKRPMLHPQKYCQTYASGGGMGTVGSELAKAMQMKLNGTSCTWENFEGDEGLLL